MSTKISDFLRLNIFKGDGVLWMIYFLLCMVSIVEIYSASSNMTFRSGHHWDPVVNQAQFLFYGFLLILLVSRIPCKYFRLLRYIGMVLTVALLAYTLTLSGTNDASRWVRFGGVSFQPSELAKPFLILFVAVELTKLNQARRKATTRKGKLKYAAAQKRCYWTVIIAAGLVCGLIAPENFSTAAMIAAVVFGLMYIGNVSLKYLGWTAAAGVAVVALAFSVMMTTPDDKLAEHARVLTWKNRITQKFNINKESELIVEDKKSTIPDERRQECCASIAIANSNIIGRGAGNSVARDFLPHAENDFIYAIIIEELGFPGAFIVMMFYVWLFIRMWRIARKSDKFFPAYLGIGLSLMLVTQALVNMAVAVGLGPVTGQTLPLISHGGTSILMTSFSFGIILSVSRYVERANEPELVPAVSETQEYADAQGMN